MWSDLYGLLSSLFVLLFFLPCVILSGCANLGVCRSVITIYSLVSARLKISNFLAVMNDLVVDKTEWLGRVGESSRID